jgi:Family of unknown function (DUF6220)
VTDAVAPTASRRWAVVAYRVMGVAFALAVTVQIFLAGLAVFTDPARWQWHTSFVHAFEGLPLLLLIVALAGRLSARLRWAAGAQLLLIVVQYATANIGGAVAAVHPVSAMIIFWLALTSLRWTRG